MRIAGWLIGSFLVASCAVLAYVRDDEGAAHGAGAAVGSLVFSVGLSMLVTLVIVKTGKSGGRVLSPGMMLAAGLVALFGLLGRVAREHEEKVSSIRATTGRGEASCPAGEPPVFARLRRDLEYERVDPSEADRLGELFAGEGHTGYSVRRVLQRGTVVGAVVSVPISDAEETRVRRGVLDGLSSRPGTPRSTVREVGRLFATVHTFPPAGDGETEQSFALLRSGCCSYLVLGAGEDEAVDIAGAVLGTARTR